MANIAVLIALNGEEPSPGSLEVLGQARRVGSQLGATVYAVVVHPAAPQDPSGSAAKLLAPLGASGADRVLWYTTEGAPDEAALVATIRRVSARLPLSLVMLERQDGTMLGQLIADDLGVTLLADARVELSSGALHIADNAPTHRDKPPTPLLVCQIPAGRYETTKGNDEIEVVVTPLVMGAPTEIPAADTQKVPAITDEQAAKVNQ